MTYYEQIPGALREKKINRITREHVPILIGLISLTKMARFFAKKFEVYPIKAFIFPNPSPLGQIRADKAPLYPGSRILRSLP